MAKDNEGDTRFTHIGKDPRFRKMQKDKRKVKIDKRFQGMFKNKNFKVKYTVDKRGRPVHLTSDDHLRKYYEMSDSESSSDESDDDKITSKGKKNGKTSEDNLDKRTQKGSKDVLKLKTETNSDKSDKNISISEEKMKKGIGKNENSSLGGKDSVSTKKNNAKPVKTKGKISTTNTETAPASISKRDCQQTRPGRRSGDESSSDVGEDSDEEDDEQSSDKDAEDQGSSVDDDEDNESSDDDHDNIDGASDEDYKPDLARGEGNAKSSDEDDDDDDSNDESEELDHNWGELDKDAVIAEETTHRLAVCNIDWDRIKAKDLMVLLNSFKSAEGTIKSVTVYPSEFGLQRMKEEDLKGPPELVEKPKEKSANEEDTEQSSREKLRKYQLNRLRYYYAVAELDCVGTAEHLYEQLNGMEYESSATRMDLRFIPNNMTFDEEPSSVATELPDLAVYKPSQFFTTALCQSKVDLTWDETDKDRTAVLSKKFSKDELEEMDVKDYLASDSDEDADPYGNLVGDFEDGRVDEEDENEEDSINKYRKLLQGIEDKEKAKDDKDMEMEISWEPGLGEKTEELINKKSEREGNTTPWEQYLQKKKEKRKQKKESRNKTDTQNDSQTGDDQAFSDDDLPEDLDLNDPYFKEMAAEKQVNQDETNSTRRKKKKLGKKNKDKELTEEDIKEQEKLSLMIEDEDDQRQHFSLAAIMENEKAKNKKKSRRKHDKLKKNEVQDNFKVDVSDSRFDAIYTSHLYNVDPSAPEYKKTLSMEAIIKEKQKRRERKEKRKLEEDENSIKTKLNKKETHDATLSSLVRSVKSKTQNLKRKKLK